MKMKRFDGKRTRGQPEAEFTVLRPLALQAKCDELQEWINEKMQRPAGLADQVGVSMIDVWSMGDHVGFTEEDQDAMFDWLMANIDEQVAHYHARQKARAHNVKYTSSGQAQWWERAMAAMT